MRDQDSYKDLTDLFAVEDASIEAAPFVARVSGGIARRTFVRRLTLTGIGLAGAVIAGMQLPGLLAEWAGVDKTVTNALTTGPAELSSAAVSQLTTLAMSNPMLLAIAAGAALSVFAVSTFERA